MIPTCKASLPRPKHDLTRQRKIELQKIVEVLCSDCYVFPNSAKSRGRKFQPWNPWPKVRFLNQPWMSRDTALGLRGERFGDSDAFFQGFIFFNFRELCSSPSQSEKWNSTVRYRKIRKSKCLLFSDVFWKSVPLLGIFHLVKVLLIRSVTKRPGTREHITKRAAILTKKKMWFHEFLSYLSKLYLCEFIYFSSLHSLDILKKKRCIYMHMSYVAYLNLPWLWTNQWRHPESYEKATVTCRLFATRFFFRKLLPSNLGFSAWPWRFLTVKLQDSNFGESILHTMRNGKSGVEKIKHKGCSTESILHVHIFKCCFQRFETYFSQLCQVATLTSISQCTSKIKKIQKIKSLTPETAKKFGPGALDCLRKKSFRDASDGQRTHFT